MRALLCLSILWFTLGLLSVVPAPGRPLTTKLWFALAIAALFGGGLFVWTVVRAWRERGTSRSAWP